MHSLTLRQQRKDIVSAMREIMGSTKPGDQARGKTWTHNSNVF